jgi:hypothetical protein
MDMSIYRFTVGKIECTALLDGIAEDPVDVLMANVDLDTVEPELAKYGLKRGGCSHTHTLAYWSVRAAS